MKKRNKQIFASVILAFAGVFSHAQQIIQVQDTVIASEATFVSGKAIYAADTVHNEDMPQDSLFPTDTKDSKNKRKQRKEERSRYEYAIRHISDTVLISSLKTDSLTGADTLIAEKYIFSDSLFRIKNGKVQVKFLLYTGDKKMRPQHKRALVPVLVSRDSLHQKELSAIHTYGRTRNLKDLRENNLPVNADTILVGKKAKGVEVYFSSAVPFEPWMDTASLQIRQKVTGCADCGLAQSDSTQMPQLLYQPEILLPAEIECPKEFSPRYGSVDAYLSFEVNKSALKLSLGSNQSELRKIDSVLLRVKGNPDYKILNMEIKGFASPEARYTYNVQLAEKRANSLKDYIARTYQVPDSMLVVFPGEENWDDLTLLIQNSGLPYKEEILRIIEEEPDYDRREQLIKQVGHGHPYRLIFEQFYPLLRKNTFSISYVSLEREINEAKNLVSSNPKELNTYEFYNVAKTFYADDTAAYRQIIMLAADTYPTHAIANANAARVALFEGDIKKARTYLLNTNYEDFTLPLRAYIAWKEGHVEDALQLWQQAAESGDPVSAHNLAEIERRGF